MLEENKNKEEIKLHAEKQIEKQKIIVGTIKPKSGHRVFQMNLETKEIEEAEFDTEKSDIDWFHAVNKDYSALKRKVKKKENHIYCSSLNKENAEKKFAKMLTSGLIFKN